MTEVPDRVIRQQTAKGRFSRAIRKIGQWCRDNRHLPIGEQHRTLSLKLRGHYEYFGITGNSRALARFREEVLQRWMKWLRRRSQKPGSWERIFGLMDRLPLPPAIAVHSTFRHAANPR